MLNIIEQLNREARMLNSQREQMIGKKEMAEKAYRDSVTEYKAKYGVQITTANVDEEYMKVENEVKNNIEKLKADILAIKNGDYKTKKELVNVDTLITPNEVVPKVNEMVTPNEIKQETAINSTVTSPVNLKEDVITQEPIKSNEVVKPNIDDGFETPSSSWGDSSKINDNFKDILGGSEFQL